jgi:hypothetical protein
MPKLHPTKQDSEFSRRPLLISLQLDQQYLLEIGQEPTLAHLINHLVGARMIKELGPSKRLFVRDQL